MDATNILKTLSTLQTTSKRLPDDLSPSSLIRNVVHILVVANIKRCLKRKVSHAEVMSFGRFMARHSLRTFLGSALYMHEKQLLMIFKQYFCNGYIGEAVSKDKSHFDELYRKFRMTVHSKVPFSDLLYDEELRMFFRTEYERIKFQEYISNEKETLLAAASDSSFVSHASNRIAGHTTLTEPIIHFILMHRYHLFFDVDSLTDNDHFLAIKPDTTWLLNPPKSAKQYVFAS